MREVSRHVDTYRETYPAGRTEKVELDLHQLNLTSRTLRLHTSPLRDPKHVALTFFQSDLCSRLFGTDSVPALVSYMNIAKCALILGEHEEGVRHAKIAMQRLATIGARPAILAAGYQDLGAMHYLARDANSCLSAFNLAREYYSQVPDIDSTARCSLQGVFLLRKLEGGETLAEGLIDSILSAKYEEVMRKWINSEIARLRKS